MTTLTRDAILGADDLETEEVEVPEWDGTVWVRTLTGKERDRFEADCIAKRNGQLESADVNLDNVRARLVVLACVDSKGESLFTPEDVDALGRKSGAALNRVFVVAQRMAGLLQKDIEELAKNS